MDLLSQNIDELWKQYQEAADKDLPKTEQMVIQQIIRTAEKKKAYGHLLKAELKRIEAITDVTPDSLQAEVKRLVDKEASLRTKKPLLAAVYQSVLGMVYKNNDTLDENGEQISKDYFRMSLSDPDLLAAQKAPDYVPLIHVQADSKYFNNDLLSVMALEAENYELLYNYYEKKGRREAACMAAALMLRSSKDQYSAKMANSKFLKQVDEMIDRYGDLDVAGELALVKYDFLDDAPDCSNQQRVAFIDQALAKWGAWPRIKQLVNARNACTQPSFSVDFGPVAVLPQKAREIKLEGLRNINSLTMDVARVDLKPNEEYYLGDEKTYQKVRKAIVEGTQFSVSRKFEPHAEYAIFNDSLTLPPLAKGIYLVEVKSDVQGMEVERKLFYVTDAFLLLEPQPNGATRIAAVSATTGKPLPNAKLLVTSYRNENDTVFDLGAKGETITTRLNSQYGAKYYLYTDDDKYCPSQSMWRSSYSYSPVRDKVSTQLFTDRSIYRPGQTVHVALLHFQVEKGLKAGVVDGKKITVRLLDANHKEVASKEVTTDEYGKAATEFLLPTAGLTGLFTIEALDGDTRFRVEEYKRPTFEVEIPDVKEEYKNGDTLTVKGVARTYSGVPVQGANVVYSVERRQASWWWGYGGRSDEQLFADSVVTDEKGEFEMTVPIRLPENVDEEDSWRTYFYDIVAEAVITDLGGESHTASISLPVSNKVTAFNFSLPERVERKSLKPVTFELKNAKGEEMEGDVVFYIDDDQEAHSAKANVPVALPTNGPLAKSGRHTIKAICHGDTVERKMVLFSVDDPRPCIDTRQWFYASHSEFPADGTPVNIQIGSSDPGTYVLYSVFSGDQVIEQGHFTLDNANQTRQWKYKDSYGDGILLTFAWVRDGKEYTKHHTIRRPMPDKRILLQWETFRDRLLPGSEETWTLKATYPSGKPADAQMMATIYDKSLDQIYGHGWYLSNMIGVSLPWARWYAFSFSSLSLHGAKKYNHAHVPNLSLSEFEEGLTEFWNPRMFHLNAVGGAGVRRRMKMDVMADMAVPMAMEESSMSLKEVAIPEVNRAEADVDENTDGLSTDNERGESDEQMDVQLRENLNETAAFLPQVVADEQGRITLKFTLPEAVTTWKVLGVATDKTINSGYISGEAIAQKDIMVVPNVPRFVRVGDKAQLTARIFNTTDRVISGKARMTLNDADTEKVVAEQTLNFTTEANGTAGVTFSFEPTGSPRLLVCKVMATGEGFSDGEQHYLPLLPETELVTRTRPFTQNRAGKLGIDLAQLFPQGTSDGRLTLEFTNNPAWLMIQALPTMAPGDSENAITQAMSYYANSLGQYIMNLSPNIKQIVMKWREETSEQGSLASNLAKNEELKDLMLNETPWVNQADREESQKRSLVKFFDEQTISIRLSSALDKLNELQNSDGFWSWWKGMEGSAYMTTAVSEMLVRLNVLIGEQDNTSRMLDRAFDFMGAKLIKEMEYAKKYHWAMPSELAMSILYCIALDGRNLEPDVKQAADYMVGLFEKKPASLTIFGKARGAVILAFFGKEAKANEYLRSIDEHAVVTEEMGRYFDTRQAYYSWCSYNIPTEVAAIEAYKMLQPENKDIVDEMRIWLLQQKRAQMWSTPINSVDAVFAFLHDNVKVLDEREMAAITIDGKAIDTSEATAGIGYVKAVENYDGQKMLEVEKSTDGTSWGAVYAQFMQKVTEVESSSSGISVKREIRNGNKPLKVGDKVVMRITVKTERDLDFVEIIDRRAACMEPTNQLSGYHYGYYIAPKDYTTAYYFNHMPKGTYVIENEYYIDRKGQYETGTCKVQCAYAPEFCATGKALSIEVKE